MRLHASLTVSLFSPYVNRINVMPALCEWLEYLVDLFLRAWGRADVSREELGDVQAKAQFEIMAIYEIGQRQERCRFAEYKFVASVSGAKTVFYDDLCVGIAVDDCLFKNQINHTEGFEVVAVFVKRRMYFNY